MLLPARTLPNVPRRGFVLLSVLVVVVVLTLAAYQYSEYMMAEYQAANSHAKLAQTKALALSGVTYTAAGLSDRNFFTSTLNSNPFDNAPNFQDILVQDDDNPKRKGRFSIVALVNPDDPQAQVLPYRYGVYDEAGKINLNALLQFDSTGTVGQQMLLKLPNMTEDIANAILDWLDPNTTSPRPNGAKDETYMSLSPPYHVKNGPLDSLEELLLVKGVTPQLLYGNDRNRNGILDKDEDDGTGVVDRGWSAYLTIYSRETNADAQGNARIYLNDPDLNGLAEKLTTALNSEDMANYLVAYRTYGADSPATAAVTFAADGKAVVAASKVSATPLSDSDADDVKKSLQTTRNNSSSRGGLKSLASVFTLINSSVSVPVGSGDTQRNVKLPSPLNDPGQRRTLLPLLLDKTTTSKASDLTARVSVNTASQTVLAALPGLSDADVQSILATRPAPSSTDTPDPIFSTPAWLITEANLSPATVQALERFITARTGVYRFQALGYYDGGGPATRLEAVVDTNNGRPRIVYLRDISELGKGFPLTSTTTSPSTTQP